MNGHIISLALNVASVMFAVLSLAIVVNTFFRIRKLKRMQLKVVVSHRLPAMKLSGFDEIKIMSTSNIVMSGDIFHHLLTRNTGSQNSDVGLTLTVNEEILSSKMIIQKEANATRSVNGKELVHG